MKTYEVSSVMYIELLSCNPTATTILNSNSLFGFLGNTFLFSKESAENEKKVGGLEKEKAALQSQLTETDGQLRQQRQLVDTAAVERDAAVSKGVVYLIL